MRQDEEDTEQHRDWQPVDGIYALGDCCAQAESPLPALAQARGACSEFGFSAGNRKCRLQRVNGSGFGG